MLKIFTNIKFPFDKYIASITILYTLFGFAIFFSASLGVMVRYEEKFYTVVNNQFFYGLMLGFIAFILGLLIHKRFWRQLSFIIYAISIFLCLLVFIPGFGIQINGSKSWLNLFGFVFQPSEILKYASILFLSSFYSIFKNKLDLDLYRLAPIAMLAFSTSMVILQPDIGTAIIMIVGISITFFVLAAKNKDMLMAVLATFFIILMAYFTLPHIKGRVQTFLNPNQDTLGQSYQINQAAIAIGSGHLYGEGYSQSVQKYHNLPEPIGDSIFAVLGEEFGFMGSLLVIFTILFLCFRLFYLAQISKNMFSKGVLTGTSGLILTQSFLNIGSISGATPLTGVPLPLVSHGSTSLIITLGMLGLCAQLGYSVVKTNKKLYTKEKDNR